MYSKIHQEIRLFKLKYFFAKLFSHYFSAGQSNVVSRCLMYHGIQSQGQSDTWDVKLSTFKDHVNCMKKMGVRFVKVQELSSAGSTNALAISFDDAHSNITSALDFLISQGISSTIYIITSFTKEDNPLYLSKNQLKDYLSTGLVELGAHGYSHKPLANLTSDEVDMELKESFLFLQNEFGLSKIGMAYPHGSFNLKVLEQTKNAGFAYAATSIPLGNEKPFDPFLVNRQAIFSYDDSQIVKNKILGKWDWMAKFVKNNPYNLKAMR